MLEGLQPPKKIPACKVRTVLESLEPKDKEILKLYEEIQINNEIINKVNIYLKKTMIRG